MSGSKINDIKITTTSANTSPPLQRIDELAKANSAASLKNDRPIRRDALSLGQEIDTQRVNLRKVETQVNTAGNRETERVYKSRTGKVSAGEGGEVEFEGQKITITGNLSNWTNGKIFLDRNKFATPSSEPIEELTANNKLFHGNLFDSPEVKQSLLQYRNDNYVSKAPIISYLPKDAKEVNVVSIYPGLDNDALLMNANKIHDLVKQVMDLNSRRQQTKGIIICVGQLPAQGLIGLRQSSDGNIKRESYAPGNNGANPNFTEASIFNAQMLQEALVKNIDQISPKTKKIFHLMAHSASAMTALKGTTESGLQKNTSFGKAILTGAFAGFADGTGNLQRNVRTVTQILDNGRLVNEKANSIGTPYYAIDSANQRPRPDNINPIASDPNQSANPSSTSTNDGKVAAIIETNSQQISFASGENAQVIAKKIAQDLPKGYEITFYISSNDTVADPEKTNEIAKILSERGFKVQIQNSNMSHDQLGRNIPVKELSDLMEL